MQTQAFKTYSSKSNHHRDTPAKLPPPALHTPSYIYNPKEAPKITSHFGHPIKPAATHYMGE